MEAIQTYPHQGLDCLMLVDLPDSGEPGPTAIRSRRHQLDLIRGIDAVHGPPVIDRSFLLAEIAAAFRPFRQDRRRILASPTIRKR